MSPKQYSEHCFKLVEDYVAGITGNTIVHSKVERQAVDIFLDVRAKYLFKRNKVNHVFRFFSLINIEYKNDIKQFQMLPYQAFLIYNVFGFFTDEVTRLYNLVLFSSAKKQGKSSFMSAIGIYLAILDDVVNASVLYVSTSTSNARDVLKMSESIILNSPDIAPFLKVMRNEIVNRNESTENRIKIRSTDKKNIQGQNTSGAIIDEIYFHEDLILMNRIRSGMAYRDGSIAFVVGTVSTKESKTYELYEMGLNILSGIVHQPSTFVYFFQQDTKEEIDLIPTQPELIRKSSPGIDFTVNTKWVLNELNTASNSITSKAVFATDHLNYWAESDDGEFFVEDEVVKNAMVKNIYDFIPTGSTVYLGNDYSSTSDLSSCAMLYYDHVKDTFYTKVYNIFPNDTKNMTKAGGLNLSHYWLPPNQYESDHARGGYVIRNQTKTLEPQLITDLVRTIHKRFNIGGYGTDPWNSIIINKKIESEVGVYVIPVMIDYKLSYPIKVLEQYLIEGRFFIDYSPITRYQFKNVKLVVDGKKNYSIKKVRGNSVDCVIALSVAMSMFLQMNYQSQFGVMFESQPTPAPSETT